MKSSPIVRQIELESHQDKGTAIARHYQTGKCLEISWENRTIKSLRTSTESSDLWIAPGLFDVQVNGFAGVDFQRTESIAEEKLLEVVKTFNKHGCTRFLLTLITADWKELLELISKYKKIIERNPKLKQAIPGFHIEGPFISSEAGFVGAHDIEHVCNPSPERIQTIKNIVGDLPIMLTLAPERKGSMESIRQAVECGFTVSLGHTNASGVTLNEAVQAGASGFTHLGNGCPQLLDRHDNILWRVLNQEKLSVGIIPDGIHVSPQTFRIFHKLTPSSHIYWTTDAMSAAASSPGRYTLGKIELEVGQDGVVRNPTTGGFAGSSLTPFEGIKRGAQMLNQCWKECWNFFSQNPARLIKLPSELEINSPAGFCFIREK